MLFYYFKDPYRHQFFITLYTKTLPDCVLRPLLSFQTASKKNGKLRPLGIPTKIDLAQQALHLLALEPVAETLADKQSYGFRPKRSLHDAIARCFTILARKVSAQWILEGDIKGHVSTKFLMNGCKSMSSWIKNAQTMAKRWIHGKRGLS